MKLNLFRKKRKDTPQVSWSNITIGQYMDIQELQKSTLDDNHLGLRLFEIVTGVDPDTVKPEVFVAKLQDIQEGLNQDFATVKLPKKITLGDTVYRTTTTSEDITVSQYFDFYQYNKGLQENLLEILSIFLVPEGHKYNDGYDMDKVRDDIRNYLTVPYIQALITVFRRRWKKSIKAFRDYSTIEIFKLKALTLKQKVQLILSLRTSCKAMVS